MMVLFLLLAIGIAWLWQKRTTKTAFDHLKADHRIERRLAEPGEPFSLILTVINSSRRILPFVKVQEILGADFIVESPDISATKDLRGMQKVFFSSWLMPGQQIEKTISLSVNKRGRYVVNGLSLYCGDFLGLCEEQRSFGRMEEVVIAPKAFPVGPIEVILGGFLGEVSARRFLFDDPVLTMGYSEYSGREPMKMISWSQSVKRNSLLVKKPDYTLEPAVTVLLNVETDLDNRQEVVETCISMARSVCETLEKEKCRYRFLSNSMLAGKLDSTMISQEGLGKRHFDGIMEQLGRATSEPNIRFAQLIQREMERPGGTGRILLTPGGSELQEPLISRLEASAGGQLLIMTGKEMKS